jgi:hypothetical protein
MKTIEITRADFEKLLSDYGHHANVKVPVQVKVADPDYFETEMRCVLNNAVVYNPYAGRGKQVGMSSNPQNAKSAMKFIRGEAEIYSSVWGSISGKYILKP